MDLDEDMNGGSQPAEETEADIERKIDDLDNYDNEAQLEILKYEIEHIEMHGLTPPEGWYDHRYMKIHEYSKIDWTDLVSRFKNKDKMIQSTASSIIRDIQELIDDRSTKPNFNLATYSQVIHNIHNVWCYYKNNYVGDEDDADVIDLIEGMAFL